MSFQKNSKVFETGTLSDFKIVRFDFLHADLSKSDVLKLEQNAVNGLPDEKFYSLIEVNDYLKINGDVKEYLISEERSWKLGGEAIVISSFTQKLFLDFYFQFNLPLVPTKTFVERKEALKWLDRLAQA